MQGKDWGRDLQKMILSKRLQEDAIPKGTHHFEIVAPDCSLFHMGYLNKLGNPDAKLNKDFLDQHPQHWLTTCYELLHSKSEQFASTSCAVTTHAALWKLGFEIEQCSIQEFSSLKEAIRHPGVVAVECDDGDHWFLIVEGHVVESWWKKYEPKVFVPDEKFIEEYGKQKLLYYVATPDATNQNKQT